MGVGRRAGTEGYAGVRAGHRAGTEGYAGGRAGHRAGTGGGGPARTGPACGYFAGLSWVSISKPPISSQLRQSAGA